MINKEEKISRLVRKSGFLLKKAVENKVFPGGVVSISRFCGGISESVVFSFGNRDYTSGNEKKCEDVFYDIASLTKPLATTLSILALLNKKTCSFDSSIEELLELDVPRDKKNINLYNLLNHSSGLAAHKEFYKEFREESFKKRGSEVVDRILNEPLDYETGSKQIYSDLGFILLGKIIEKKAKMSLADFVERNIYRPLGISENIFFNNENIVREKKVFAPTEACGWRKKVLCGQVHDDNAYGLGGVCGHAGLFADIFGVSDLVNSLIDIIKGRKKVGFIKKEDLQRCVTRQSDKGSWGLGFDTPSDLSSSGRFFSKKSFGHLGFTGTSFWADLEKDISITLLTNRVHPDRGNSKIKKFRPIFHDLVMSILLEDV